MGEPTFELWRILGNDLPPRHAPDQTLTNTRFLLEREPELPECRKRWLLNRIVDPAVEAALQELLEAHGQPVERIPFDASAYGSAPYDPTGLPDDVLRGAPLPPPLQARAQEFPFRHKVAAATDLNGARNRAVALSRAAGATWALPWDGACALRADAWDEVRAAAEDPHARYLVVPVFRLDRNDDAFDPAVIPEVLDEPMVAFHRDAAALFDPAYRYGNASKVELLVRLRVAGPWSQRVAAPWERTQQRTAADADRVVTTGWVGRLASGAPRSDVSGAARFQARTAGLLGLVDRLDRAKVLGRSHPRELALYDAALLSASAQAGGDGRAIPLVAAARHVGEPEGPARPWPARWAALARDTVTLTLAGVVTRDAGMRQGAARRLLAATTGPDALLAALPQLDRTHLADLLAPVPAVCDAVRILNQTGELPRDANRAVRAWADGVLASLPGSSLGRSAVAHDDAPATVHDVATVALAAFVGRPERLLAGVRAAIRRAAWQFDEAGVARGTPRQKLGVLVGWSILARYSEVVGEPLWTGVRTGRASPASAALELLALHEAELPADAVAAFRHVVGLPSPAAERLARERGEVAEEPLLQAWWWARAIAPAPRVR